MAKCPKCGVENHQGASVCVSCGGDMSASVRYCVSCGRSIDFGANVCPYCGHDFRAAPAAPAAASLSTGMKVLLYLASIFVWIAGVIIGIVFMAKDDPEYKRVGKICLILGVVSILLTVGMSALLYVMVSDFTGGEVQTPTATLNRSFVVGGWEFTIAGVHSDVGDVEWSDVSVTVTSAGSFASWTPYTADLTDDSYPAQKDYGSKALGEILVTLSIVDLVGNGRFDPGDSLTLTASPLFDQASDYSLALLFEPTAAPMAQATFSG